MDASLLPTVNAALNATTTALLCAGWVAIRRGNRRVHRGFMLAALATSALFLTSYLLYHAQAGSRRFVGPEAVRTVYLGILLTHTVLAVVLVPLVATTLIRALRERFDRHRQLARWTLPVWLYVSVTGVVVYWMLYRVSW